MIPLIASLVALGVAPLLYRGARRHAKAHSVMERLILAGLALAVVTHLLPDSYHAAGWLVLVVALLGMGIPSLIERLWHQMEGSIHWVPLGFGIVGLALHSLFDGAALVGPDAGGGGTLAWAVVLHRIPVGLLVWWTLYPKFGLGLPAAVLAAIGLLTVVGYGIGLRVLPGIGSQYAFGLFQALVSGSLLHLGS